MGTLSVVTQVDKIQTNTANQPNHDEQTTNPMHIVGSCAVISGGSSIICDKV